MRIQSLYDVSVIKALLQCGLRTSLATLVTWLQASYRVRSLYSRTFLRTEGGEPKMVTLTPRARSLAPVVIVTRAPANVSPKVNRNDLISQAKIRRPQ